MSGHSKWSTIKRQKGAADAKRGQIFTKLSNAITVAVRQGGGITDPASNFKLRLAIEKARASNMPKDNIERAIAKGRGAAGSEVVELVYEGFGPGGAALIIEAVTDNKQRTVSDVKNILEKSGGSLGTPGAVSYLFKKSGELIVKKEGKSSDDLLSIGLEAGVEDFKEEDEAVLFYVDAATLQESKKKLEKKGLTLENAEIVYVPENEITLDPEKENQLAGLIDRLNDSDDIQAVYTNAG